MPTLAPVIRATRPARSNFARASVFAMRESFTPREVVAKAAESLKCIEGPTSPGSIALHGAAQSVGWRAHPQLLGIVTMLTRNGAVTAGVIVVAWLAAWVSSASAIEPVRVVPPGMLANVREPQAAVGPKGEIYVVFGAADSIYCSVSNDGGRSFADPVRVGELGKLALGMRRGPRVAVNESGVVVTAIAAKQKRAPAGELWAWHSTDGGTTWQQPVTVNDVEGAAREGLHALAPGPRDQFAIVWLDLRHGKQEVVGSFSRDGGKTWSDNRLIYASPDGNVCECCHPSVAIDKTGTIYVMWRNQLDGARDMYLSSSSDAGKSFTQARKLGSGTWMKDGCPMDGGALAIGAGTVESIWRRDKDIFRAGLDGDEERIGAGEQPWAAAGVKGTYMVWLSRRQGDLLVLTPGAKKPRQLAASANDPVIVTPVAGQGPAVVVGESGRKESATIFALPVEPGKSAKGTKR